MERKRNEKETTKERKGMDLEPTWNEQERTWKEKTRILEQLKVP